MRIHIVGGVYRETCIHPYWNETYGSAGRAASCLAALGVPVTLHSYMDSNTSQLVRERAILEKQFRVEAVPVAGCISFDYIHSLAVPQILGVPVKQHAPIQLQVTNVIRFGMLEGDSVVEATHAVYDPQNVGAPKSFAESGSKAKHLALILNLSEARQLSKLHGKSVRQCAKALSHQENAEVVVIKMGPHGAFVWTRGKGTEVPALRTDKVWKIGSGDCFVAHFGQAWICQKLGPVEAARVASRATAYFCETQGFANGKQLAVFNRPKVTRSTPYIARLSPLVYLAAPFFNMQQRWMIEQVRDNLLGMGLRVFSPFHNVGLGSAEDVVSKDIEGIKRADVLFAIADGRDVGTIYEIGFARALNKPVVVYSESESDGDLKMIRGSNCIVESDYATAIYRTTWEAMNT